MHPLFRWIRLGAGGMILGSFALVLAPVDTSAQVKVAVEKDAKGKEKKKREEFTDGLFLIIDRDASRKIDAVKDYLKKDKVPWVEICEVMQTLLEDPSDKLVETYRESPDGRIKVKVSLKEEINRTLASFNKEGREFYQLTYGPRAEAKLRDALNPDSGDGRDPMQKMADVATKYLHTKAGAEAIVRLGTWHLDRGRYLMAALTLRKFESRSPDDALSPSILLKLALAYKRLGEAKQAGEYWDKLEKAVPTKELVLGGRKFTLEQLRGEYDRILVKGRNEATEYTMIGGDATHNAQGIGSRPFLDPRFTNSLLSLFEIDREGKLREVKKPGMEWIQQNLQQAMERIARSNSPAAIPAFFPVTLPGKIIYRTYDRVRCVSTHDTADSKAGDLEWDSETDASLYKMVTVPEYKRAFEKGWWGQFYAQNGPHGIMFENGLVGSLSHDGRYVYYVDDLFVPPHPQQIFNNNMGMGLGIGGQGINFGGLQDLVSRSALVAIDIATGQKAWTTAASRKPEDAGKPKPPAEEVKVETAATLFADCFFLGAPLPVAGKIYVMLEKDREMILACINPLKLADNLPELEWYQPLGSPQQPLPQDTFRRIQGVHLAYGDGILVCPSNAGALVGIDLQTRNIVWSHSYRKAPPKPVEDPNVMMQRRMRGMMNDEGMAQTIPENRWRISYPILTRNKVVFTAYDSESVQCLDLRSGSLAWESARNADDLYVAGVFEDRVMVVGKSSARFLSLADGSQVGSSIAIGLPSGMGTASAGKYLLPIKESPETHEPEIWTIDVAKGTVDAKTRSRKKTAVGNLLFHEGDVFSQSPFELVAFPQLQVKKDEMVRRLAADPNDPAGLLALGELQLDDGELLPAITTLKKVLGGEVGGELRARARTKLYESMTEYVQGDFPRAEPFLTEYRELCSVVIPPDADPVARQTLLDEELRRKSNYYAMVGKGRELQGRLLEAFENYQIFGTLVGTRDLVSVPDQPLTSARPDVWARGRLEAMVRGANPQIRKPLEEKIDAEWEKVRGANDLEQLRSFVKLFGSAELASGNESRLLLAEKLAASQGEEDLREAELLLLNLETVRSGTVAPRATDLLAKLYMKRNLFESAIRAYRRLGTEYASVTLPDGRTGEAAFGELVTDKRFLPYLEPARVAWPDRLQAKEIPGNSAVLQSFPILPDDDDSSPYFDRNRVFVDTNFNNSNQWCLRVVDKLTGAEWRSKPMASPQANAFFLGNQPGFNYARLYQVRGHILIIQCMNMVYAFDLAAKKPLWPEYNLFGKNPPLQPQNGQGNQTTLENGDLMMLYADGWKQRMGRIGLLQPNYLCLIAKEGLVALDPNNGTVLWTKKDVVPGVRLFGDRDYVFFYELNANGAASAPKAVRASDGVEVPVPDNALLLGNARHLRFYGRGALVQENEGEKRSLRLVDMLTGKDLWKRECAERSIPAATDDQRIAGFVTLAGGVQLFDGLTGRPVFAASLGADKPLLAEQLGKAANALVLADADRIYLGFNRPGGSSNTGFINTIRTVPLNGVLYAFDRKTGRREWYTDEQFLNQHLVVDRFAEMPVLIASSQQFNNGNNQFRTAVLDKKTGKMLYGALPAYNGQGNQFFTLSVDSKAKAVEILRSDLRIRIADGSAKSAGADPARPGVPTSGSATIQMKK